MLDLKGRTVRKTVDVRLGATLLEHARKNKIDVGYNCTRGTCARCRCLITQGAELLSEPTGAELDRLGEDEIAEGFRLGCQTRIISDGEIQAMNKFYF